MTSTPDPDRAAFEAWANAYRGINILKHSLERGAWGAYVADETTRMHAAYLAGLAHARQEAQGQIKALERERDKLKEQPPGIRGMFLEANGLLRAAYDALPSGYRVDAEHDLAARVRELARKLEESTLYAQELAGSFGVEPLGDIYGALTQLDNGIVGLRRDVADAQRSCSDVEFQYHKDAAPLTAAERAVVDERRKQREKWGDDHDDQHGDGQLAQAASDLAESVGWPMRDVDDEWGLVRKNKDPRERCIIGAALLVAEAERLSRERAALAAEREPKPKPLDPWELVRHVRTRFGDRGGYGCDRETADWIRATLDAALSQREGGGA